MKGATAASSAQPATPAHTQVTTNAEPQPTLRTTAQQQPHTTPIVPQQTKQQPTIANRMMSFSIRSGNQTKQEVKEEEAIYAQQPTVIENKPVDNVNLTIKWREFVKSLPKEETGMAMQMDILEPMMQEDGTSFLLIIDNPSFLNSLTKIKPRIENYLRAQLHNSNLTMTMRLREITDKKRTYTKMEYYNMMLKESEGLRKLREAFNLELS